MSRTIHKKDKFLNKLSQYFEKLPFSIKGKSLCVCFSGGADSTALLAGLKMLSEEYSFGLSACHFNHLIRGEEAYRDEQFCKNICESLGVKLYCGRDDVPSYAALNKLSLEEAARECRYNFFARIIDKKSVDYCVTAHNMNDDAETLIFNLVRGSGINGASSISPYSDLYLRPMLNISRDEIIKFITSNGLEYVNDSTNFSNDYTRNYIRNVIFPELQSINPSVVDALSRYIASVREDRIYFDNVARENENKDLRTLQRPIRARIITSKFKAFTGRNLNFDLINTIDEAIFSNKRTVVPVYNLYHCIVYNGCVEYYNIDVCQKVLIDNVALCDGVNSISDKIIIEISDKKVPREENFNKLYTTQLLSFDNISGGIYARQRKTGDKITVKGINKSLKKLFIDMKIPKEYRDSIPIICDDKGIIYVPFVGVSDRAYPLNADNKKYVTTVLNSIDKERWSTLYEE